MSAFIESMTFSGLQAAGASRNTAFAGAIGTTAAFGIGREIHDKKTKGLFSLGDLTWDGVGTGAAWAGAAKNAAVSRLNEAAPAARSRSYIPVVKPRTKFLAGGAARPRHGRLPHGQLDP